MRTWRFQIAAVLGFAVLGACSDSVTAPIGQLSPIGALRSAGGGGVPLFANSTQYRPQTMPHQSRRSGSATLTSRALLGKDGMTVLEVTTGALGTSTAPGNISKLQLKFFDPQDTEMMAVRNYNGLSGGYQTLTLGGLPRHAKIQTQGNVRDIDPRRTDVVTISERVNLRPDLAVVGLMAPERVRPNQEFVITADVKELNGDVGAFDDCVLYVAGSEKERIVGQWVADGDMVTCAFKHTFANPGIYDLTVKSENVLPGDWDLGNNSASRSIEVVNPEIPLQGYAGASHRQWSFRSSYYGNWVNGGGLGTGQYEYSYVQENNYSQAYFYAEAPSGGPMASASLSITDQNGTTLTSLGGPANGGTCAYYYAAYGYDWFYSCSSQYGTWTNGGSYGGVAVYYGRQFYETCWDGSCYTFYDNRWSYPSSWGSGIATSGPLTINVRIEGTNGSVYTANPTVPMTYSVSFEYPWYYTQPLTCSSWSDSYGNSSEYCYEQLYSDTYQSGYVYF